MKITRPKLLRWCAYAGGLLALLLLLYVRFGRTPDNAHQGGPEAAKSPQQLLLDKVLSKYRQANAYRDRGKIHWEQQDGDQWRTVNADLATTFQRPNKLDLRVHGLRMACDGKHLRAVIKDRSLANYDGQMLDREAPQELTLDQIYADGEIADLLHRDGFGGPPWPLRMLLADDEVADWVNIDRRQLVSKTPLPDAPIDGKSYHRVQVFPDTTLWIDPATHTLRRIELPAPPEASGIRGVYADFADVQWNADVKLDDDTFKFPASPGARRVHFFVRPPQKIEYPAPLFGEVVGDFSFTAPDGTPIARESLQGKIAVLAWFVDRPEALAALAQLQKIAERYRQNEQVVFYAVSPLPDAVTTESIQAALDQGKITLPLARDNQAQGRYVFDVPGAPTIVVLDGQHRLQVFAHPQLKEGPADFLSRMLPESVYRAGQPFEEFLHVLIDELLAGKNPAGEIRSAAAQEASDYRRQLAAARAHASATEIELLEVQMAPARAPQKLKLTKLWTCTEIKSPGNILAIDAGVGAPMILVCEHSEDWRTVVELNASGKVVARRTLPVDENAAISLLRTIVDKDGRRWYAGSARLGRQVYVFDEKWQLACSYPPPDARHEGVGDFVLADFEGEGTPQLCAGFWGVLGVHGVSLEGKNLWVNRRAAPAISLAAIGGKGWRQLLVATDRGEIVPINADGASDSPVQVEKTAITQIVSAKLTAQAKSAFMGVSMQPDGTPVATALATDLTPLWDVPLVAGAHRNQIEWVASGELWPGDTGHWLFAGADGSIRIVSDDSSSFDSFAVGEELTGIAVAKLGKEHALLVATVKGVTAYRLAH